MSELKNPLRTIISRGFFCPKHLNLANHLHHKKRAETFKASTHILRIGI